MIGNKFLAIPQSKEGAQSLVFSCLAPSFSLLVTFVLIFDFCHCASMDTSGYLCTLVMEQKGRTICKGRLYPFLHSQVMWEFSFEKNNFLTFTLQLSIKVCYPQTQDYWFLKCHNLKAVLTMGYLKTQILQPVKSPAFYVKHPSLFLPPPLQLTHA